MEELTLEVSSELIVKDEDFVIPVPEVPDMPPIAFGPSPVFEIPKIIQFSEIKWQIPEWKDRPMTGPPPFDIWRIRNRVCNLDDYPSALPKIIGERDMESYRERIIREMAHLYWEHEGRPEGRSEIHWLKAEMDFNKALPSASNPWF